MSTREPSSTEIETLKEVLVAALPKTSPDSLTTAAKEIAIAVRIAFEELTKPRLSE